MLKEMVVTINFTDYEVNNKIEKGTSQFIELVKKDNNDEKIYLIRNTKQTIFYIFKSKYNCILSFKISNSLYNINETLVIRLFMDEKYDISKTLDLESDVNPIILTFIKNKYPVFYKSIKENPTNKALIDELLTKFDKTKDINYKKLVLQLISSLYINQFGYPFELNKFVITTKKKKATKKNIINRIKEVKTDEDIQKLKENIKKKTDEIINEFIYNN